ncbi:hypothetical protein BGX31_007932 [Mortierella sp. GBA43]|nr:hypothetical protein BGX31_007932 [Mortierella sp. GBA43]
MSSFWDELQRRQPQIVVSEASVATSTSEVTSSAPGATQAPTSSIQVDIAGIPEPSNLASSFTEQDRDLFLKNFLALEEKCLLPSGAYAEDIMFVKGMDLDSHHLIHSYIVDTDDPLTKSLFTKEDWAHLLGVAEPKVALEDSVRTFADSFKRSSLRDIMDQINNPNERLGASYDHERDFNLKWIRDSTSKWVNLYTMKPDPFVTKELTEHFWRTRAWGVIDDLFGDVHNIVMISGDAAGIDSATRKNSQKRKERSWKIGRELHDIFSGRAGEFNDSLGDLAVFGIIFGGPTIQVHALKWAGGSCTSLRRFQPLRLASKIASFSVNIVVLKFLLLLKAKIVRIEESLIQDVNAEDLFTWNPDSGDKHVTINQLHPSPKKRKST